MAAAICANSASSGADDDRIVSNGVEAAAAAFGFVPASWRRVFQIADDGVEHGAVQRAGSQSNICQAVLAKLRMGRLIGCLSAMGLGMYVELSRTN